MAETAEHISTCIGLAILFEVSAYPKLGNVHQIFDLEKTRYEHFLTSAVAVVLHLKHATERES